MLQLTEIIDPWNAAEQNTIITGNCELSQLPRLSGMVIEPTGNVQCKVRFFQENYRHCITVQIWGTVHVACQRCLGLIETSLKTEVLLALVANYAAMDTLPNIYEPLIVMDRKIKVLNIVEDEILLALPDFPVHEIDKDCVIINN
jgi:uncharacterized protein